MREGHCTLDAHPEADAFADERECTAWGKQKCPTADAEGHFESYRSRAVGEGFEPPGPVRALRFSRPVHSTRLCHPTVEIPCGEHDRMSNIGLHDHPQLVPPWPGFGLKKSVKGLHTHWTGPEPDSGSGRSGSPTREAGSPAQSRIAPSQPPQKTGRGVRYPRPTPPQHRRPGRE